MIEFNLIPDVKLQFIKTQKLKHLILSASIILSIVSIVIIVIAFIYVEFIQTAQISNLDKNITSYTIGINQNKNLNKILTIQNQLSALPNLESQTPTTSRIFNYLSDLVPIKITISDIKVDLTQNTMNISGGADSLSTVNQFIDTLKYTNYKNGSGPSTSAFSNVILSSFGYGSNNSGSSSGGPAQFNITFSFDPTIFSPADNINLLVPNLTTTRSVLNQPLDLFKSNPKPTSTSSSTNTTGN